MIQRKLLEALKAHLPSQEITLIVGPRQAGKTTLMLVLKEALEKQEKKTLFLSLDFEADRPFLESQQSLVRRARLEFGNGPGTVFIDEIQRKDNAGLFLKGLYDLHLPYKFIVSGSGSVELKEKVHESLVGRKRVFDLSTVSFAEFVDFKTDYRYTDRFLDFFRVESRKSRDLLIEYLSFGGYPRMVTEGEFAEKRMIIDDIYRSYLERDISYVLKVEKTEAFSSLIKLLAGQAGRLVNYSELSSTLGISLQTVKKYLWYGEKTFILERVSPFFRNVRKEITKAPVVYFHDVGLRNYALGLFGIMPVPSTDLGFLFQNLALHLLKEKLTHTPAEIHFWRTKDRAEVDFVIQMGNRVIPVEVKFKELKQPEIGRSLRSFIQRYAPERAWVINLSLSKKTEVKDTKVEVLPFYEVIFKDWATLFGEHAQSPMAI